MRRWSGLFFGLAIVVLAACSASESIWVWRSQAEDVGMYGRAPERVHLDEAMETWDAEIAANVQVRFWFAALYSLGAALALVGAVLWIREARAAKRPDAGRVFE